MSIDISFTSAPHQTGYGLVSEKRLEFPEQYGIDGEVLATHADGTLFWKGLLDYKPGFALFLDGDTFNVDIRQILKYINIPTIPILKGTDRQISIKDNQFSTPQNLDKEATVQFKTLVVEDILLNGVPLAMPSIPEPIKYSVGFGMKQKDNLLSVNLEDIQASIKFPKLVSSPTVQVSKGKDGYQFETNVRSSVGIDLPNGKGTNGQFLVASDTGTKWVTKEDVVVEQRLSFVDEVKSLDKLLFKVVKPGMYEVRCVVESATREKVHLNWTDSRGTLNTQEGLAWCIMCKGNTEIKFVIDRVSSTTYSVHFVVIRI